MNTKPLPGKKVLIIHFEGSFIRNMKKNLERLGAEIRVAHDAEAAEKIISENKFNLVVGCKIIPGDVVAYRIYGMNKKKSAIPDYQGFRTVETKLPIWYQNIGYPFITFLFPPQVTVSENLWIKIDRHGKTKIMERFNDFFNPEAGLTQKIVELLGKGAADGRCVSDNAAIGRK